MNARILVVDHERRDLTELQSCLAAGPEWEWSGPIGDGPEVMEALVRLNPDLILLSLDLPGSRGEGLLRGIREVHPRAGILAVGRQPDPDLLRNIFRAGVRGFCLSDELAEELPLAAPAMVRGRHFICSAAAEAMVGMAIQASRTRPSGIVNRLTGRENEVLTLLVAGLSTKQTAARMGLASKTVDTHRKNLMQKLEVDSVVDLVKLAIREGLTSL